MCRRHIPSHCFHKLIVVLLETILADEPDRQLSQEAETTNDTYKCRFLALPFDLDIECINTARSLPESPH